LIEFLRTKREQASSPDIDWQAKKDSWIRSVESLYGLIEQMLSDSSEDVRVRRFDVEATEEFIGTYNLPALELRIGNERVEFRPKGVTVIGAAGRVDLRGERDTVTLIKDKPDQDSEWSVILQRIPQVKRVKLDRESLRYALERVMMPLP